MGQLTQTTPEVQTALDGACASIYVDGGSTDQAIANGASYVKCTAFTTNGVSINCTADATNDKITITKAGTYQVVVPVSFSGSAANQQWWGAVFIDGVEQGNMHFERKVGSGAGVDVGAASCSGLVTITSVPVDVDFRVRHDDTVPNNIKVRYANLSVHLVGQ